MKLTPAQQLEQYMLMRSLWWKHHLHQLDAQTIAQMLTVLETVKRDLRKKLAANTDTIAGMQEWSSDRAREVDRWVDTMTADVRASLTSGLVSTSVAAAGASLAEANSILTFEGLALNVKTVGLTAEQLAVWFRDTPLGASKMRLGDWINRAFENGAQESIREALRESIVTGEGTAARVKRVLNRAVDDGFAITEREAITIARTYTAVANNSAMETVFKKNEGIIKGYRRVETLDNRTCITCGPRDGDLYLVGEQRPELPAHPNCFTGDTDVYSPDIISIMRAKYSGPILTFVLSDGGRFSVTPNHKLLTSEGFATADSIANGDYILSSPANACCLPVFPKVNTNNSPSSFSDIFRLFSMSGELFTASSVGCVDFNGDEKFIDGEVDIVTRNSFLSGGFKSLICEFVEQFKLAASNVSGVVLSDLRESFSARLAMGLALKYLRSNLRVSDLFFVGRKPESFSARFGGVSDRNTHVPNSLPDSPFVCRELFCDVVGRISRRIQGSDFLRWEMDAVMVFFSSLFEEFSSLNAASKLDPVSLQNSSYGAIGASSNLSNVMHSGPSSVHGANVVVINRENYFGHVYDLHTFSTVYNVHGTIASNCRGLYIPVPKGIPELGLDFDSFDNVRRSWTEREDVIGAGGAKVANFGTHTGNFEGWWKTQPPHVQEQSIGPVRAELVRTGQLKFSDITDKHTGRVNLLEEKGFSLAGNSL